MNTTTKTMKTAIVVKTSLKAGGVRLNHNQTATGLATKSNVRAGGLFANHNQTVR